MTSELTNESVETQTAAIPRAVFFFAALMMIVAGLVALWAARNFMTAPAPGNQEIAESPQIPPGEWVTSFELQERNGKTVGSEDLKGQVWVANFFYSTCPGSCRQQTMLVSSLEKDFRDKGVRFVSITCDPKQDTPTALREYAHDFNAPKDWWFLTGDLLYIRRIGAEFFTLAVSEKGHQDRLAVVDKWGNVRGRFNWHDEQQMEKLKELVDELVVETEPPVDESDDPAAQPTDGASDSDDTDAPDEGALDDATGESSQDSDGPDTSESATTEPAS